MPIAVSNLWHYDHTYLYGDQFGIQKVDSGFRTIEILSERRTRDSVIFQASLKDSMHVHKVKSKLWPEMEVDSPYVASDTFSILVFSPDSMRLEGDVDPNGMLRSAFKTGRYPDSIITNAPFEGRNRETATVFLGATRILFVKDIGMTNWSNWNAVHPSISVEYRLIAYRLDR